MGLSTVTFSTELVSIVQLKIKKLLAYFSNARSSDPIIEDEH